MELESFVYRSGETNGHISVTLRNRTNRDQILAGPFCGDNWCNGRCGLPALLLDSEDGFGLLKLSGSQVAVGQVWQRLRQPWNGISVEFRETFGLEPEDLPRMLKSLWL